MDTQLPPKSWKIEQILEDLDLQGFAIIDHVYPKNYVTELVKECNSHLNQFREAAVQNGVVNSIRSDHILWIHDGLEKAQQHIQALKAFSDQLNRAYFSGIKDIEAHFACYNAGEFYALHRDNPQGKNGRVISTVYYLHDHWQDDWGGELRLQDKSKQWHIIQPRTNRLVIFQSDLLHEVLLAQQQRLSITAWLRNDNSIFSL